jgi:aminoglycoside phosphotransferase (APT) family kinase protein
VGTEVVSDAPAPGKTQDDPQRHRERLDAWLRRQRPDARELRIVRLDMPRATGFSNETVFFDVASREGGQELVRRYVARVEQQDGPLFPVQTPACEISVELQHRVMVAVAESGAVPVPPLVAYEPDAEILGRPFFVMEFVAGEIPGDVPRYSQQGFLVEKAGPAQRGRLVRDGIERFAALQRIDWRHAGLDWLDPSGGAPSLRQQLDLHRDYALRELRGREHPVLLRALDWLAANAPDARAGLSWGDARIGNMIWQDYRCAAVLDWEAAALLPPEADLGWWIMFDRMSFDDMGVARLEGFPTREEMVELWQERSRRAVAGGIDYWEIFAVMRFCAIMVKLGDRLTRRGLAPPEAELPVRNGTTDALERLLAKQGA